MTLLIAVILAIAAVGSATTVQAQTVSLPRAQLVDAENVLVGELVSASPLTVLLRVGRLTFALYVENKHTLATVSQAVFETNDCSGPMYMEERPGMLEDVAIFDSVRVYVADPSVPRQMVNGLSSYYFGRCNELATGSRMLRPTRLLVDLTGRWTSPYRVR